MRYVLVLLLLILCTEVVPLAAQQPFVDVPVIVADSFVFVAMRKTQVHPYYDLGSRDCFAVNGLEGATLLMKRNSTYPLKAQDMDTRYNVVMATDAKGFKEFFGDIVPGNWITGNATMYFTPRKGDPDTIYYADLGRAYSGGMILIVDSIQTISSVPPDVNLPEERYIQLAGIVPNPASNRAEIHFSLASTSEVQLEITNALGEVILEQTRWFSGGTDASLQISVEELPPGIYLYRLITRTGGYRQVAGGQVQVVR
jgi:hypothetical protein